MFNFRLPFMLPCHFDFLIWIAASFVFFCITLSGRDPVPRPLSQPANYLVAKSKVFLGKLCQGHKTLAGGSEKLLRKRIAKPQTLFNFHCRLLVCAPIKMLIEQQITNNKYRWPMKGKLPTAVRPCDSAERISTGGPGKLFSEQINI